MKDFETNLLNCTHYIASVFSDISVSYFFVDSSSLWIQGVKVKEPFPVKVQFQWDGLEEVYQAFQIHQPSPIEKGINQASFRFNWNDIEVELECIFNTTVRTNPYRIQVLKQGVELGCISLYNGLYSNPTQSNKQEIHTYLFDKQHSITANNESAWNQNQYDALIKRYGDPKIVADKIVKNPEWRLHPFGKYLQGVEGSKVAHLMGSNGMKGVALSLLGAEVTVVDFSKENEKYAMEIARSANISIEYIVQDILSLADSEEFHDRFNVVLMELGVLHYFLDLKPLFDLVKNMLVNGGKLVLHEFHPVSTKLITSSGKKHKVTGNYFEPSIEENQVAFSKHMEDGQKQELMTVLQRKWTLGELVTAVAQSGLTLSILEEEPNHKSHDIGLPKTFTLVAYNL